MSIFVELAILACVNFPHYEGCVDWMVNCQIAEQARAEEWSSEIGVKRCEASIKK